jgi:hypothetical protein
MAISIRDYQRQMEEMMRHQQRQMKEDMYRQMANTYPYEFTESGSGYANVAVSEPEAPKHLNHKLLLTKGA